MEPGNNKSSFKLRSGNKPSPMQLSGISPMKNDKKKKEEQKKTESEFIKNISEYSENLPYIKPILTKEEAEQQKKIKIPFLGPAPNNPKQGSFINVPKLGTAKKPK
jgi:hypothetical protein